MRVAIFDDDPTLLRVIENVLHYEGYEVGTFPGSAFILETGRAPDLFLIDRGLEELDGIDLAARLSDAGFEATPKIAMSASRPWLRLASESLLFADIFEKPFDVTELLRCVGQCRTAHSAPSRFAG